MELPNSYEKIRDERIAKNKARLEEFGVIKIAKSLATSKCNKRREKEKSCRFDKDREYVPNNNEDVDSRSDIYPPRKIHVTRSDTQHRVTYIPPRSMKKYTNIGKQGSTMNNGCPNTNKKESGIELLFDKEHPHERHNNVEAVNLSQKKSGKNITMAELLLRKKSLERANNVESNRHGGSSLGQIFENEHVLEDSSTRLPVTQHEFEHVEYEDQMMLENSARRNSEDDDMSSDSEEEAAEYETEQLNIDSRDVELDGKIARDYSCAPIVFHSWRKVPQKDKIWQYVLKKYIVPDEGKDWVLKTIGAAWRVYKCRFKAEHYYKYEDDKTRWKNRSKRVPDEDFKKLLATWKKKDEKERCDRNRACRLAQKNMHIAGPKSFATIREKMKNEHPNKEAPSLAEMFERTRRRNEGRIYKESFEDTANKIEQMKSFVPLDDGSGPSDEAFFDVMGKEYNGRCKLYGRGVNNTKLKNVAGTTSSYVVPAEILESLKTSLFEDMRNDMDSEINKVLQMKKEMEEENARKKIELENMQAELNNEKENMTEQIMRKILEKIPPEVARQYLS